MALSPLTEVTVTLGGVIPTGESWLSGFSETSTFEPQPSAGAIASAALSPLDGRVPHLVWPLRLEAGELATVEQDTVDDVRQCVHVLLRTPLGVRPLAPDVGVDDPTFSAGVDPDQLRAVLEAQEDRASVAVEAGPLSVAGAQQVVVRVGLADSDEEPA